jgi:hypothetical protein
MLEYRELETDVREYAINTGTAGRPEGVTRPPGSC